MTGKENGMETVIINRACPVGCPGVKSPVDSLVSLRWSSEPPTAPGWYWTKTHHGTDWIEQVHENPQIPGQMTILENTWMGWKHQRIDVMGRMWAGPIPKPLPSSTAN
jgi:hypothetical protein